MKGRAHKNAIMRGHRWALPLLLVGLTGGLAQAQKKVRVQEWKAYEGGWSLVDKEGTFHTTLDKKELLKIRDRILELRPAYEKHFGTKLKKGWTFVVFADRKDFEDYAAKVTKGRKGVQGQCFRAKKTVTVCNARRYGWLSTLSHEYAHAYYDSQGPIWLREGIASLVEVAEIRTRGKGKRKKIQMTIPVNPPRLRGLRLYQKKGHYLSIQHLVRGEKETDGYGYSYEHGWSLHYFLYHRDPARYEKFLKAVRKKTKRDLSSELKKIYGLDVKKLDQLWQVAIAELKA